MKNILCFGDSNTFGFNPHNAGRYAINERWSGILKESLKEKFNIVEAGCNNRTGFVDNPNGIMQTGYKILSRYLSRDIDILFLAVGINDLQFAYNFSLEEVEVGLENFIQQAKMINSDLKILIISPSVISDNILKNSFFSTLFDKLSVEKSKKMSDIYSKVAKKFNCDFVDLNNVAEVSEIDGLHYEIEEHNKIAKYLYNYILANYLN